MSIANVMTTSLGRRGELHPDYARMRTALLYLLHVQTEHGIIYSELSLDLIRSRLRGRICPGPDGPF